MQKKKKIIQDFIWEDKISNIVKRFELESYGTMSFCVIILYYPFNKKDNKILLKRDTASF